MEELLKRLVRIESLLEQIQSQRETKEFYSTAEVAEIMERSEYTVREWCRHSQIRAEKAASGRGTSLEWRISHKELQRLRNEGPYRKAIQRRTG